MSEELKPCPFCGKIPKPDWTDESYIECTNRKCDIYSFGMSTGAWNTRPIEDALTARIAELEEKQRWIPVSERMPDNWKTVLTIDISKSTRDAVTAFYNPETSRWSTHSAGDLWVTHWMPSPEPPIMYGKERD